MNRPAAQARIRGILVDLDGVVRLWRRQGANAAEAELGLPPRTLSAYTSSRHSDAAHAGALTWGQWTAGVRERMAAGLGTDSADRAFALWSADRGEPNPAMVSLLRRARAAGLTTALLTNNTTILDADLAHHRLDTLFDHILNSAISGLTKPSPRAYEHALATMGLSADQVAFTDDSDINSDAARALGLHAHHFREPGGADAFEQHLAGLGITLPSDPGRPTPPEPVKAVAPPPGHAEHDDHQNLSIRYLATGLPADAVATRLTTCDAAWAQPTNEHTLASGGPDGRVTQWRLVPSGTEAAHAAGHPGAWMPQPAPPGAEYLPPWTAATRAEAARHATALLTETAAALTRTAGAHRGGDRLSAALHLDTARHALTRLASMLARRQPRPWPDATHARYLGHAATTLLTISLTADPTTPTGLCRSVTALLHLLNNLRRASALLLGAETAWPWPDLERHLVPLLDATLTAPGPDVLYGARLAATYDDHRAVAPALADALRAFSADHLAGRDVLELGAGTGRITAHLASGASTYTALEASPDMAALLTARNLPGVRLFLGDALAIPLPDASADTVVEHEALLFTGDPLAATDQALRVLRPDGQLVRLLLHAHGDDPAADLDAAYRSAAFQGRPAPLITGKGTDHLVTTHLAADHGLATTDTLLAEYTDQRPLAEVLSALAARAWPYQHQADTDQHAAGMAAAEELAQSLPHAGQPVRYRLRALTTRLEAR
ncbi:HAD-IA family hydrolase [Kitasatospora sp. NPDC058046]|uniref:HAD-IA family hydrolase n=1 Tax=Kitasatospora sp. NPDC058046 TaxID=3346312 RepID=UPI0036DB71B3